MHKVILVYGPTSLQELRDAMDRHVGEATRKARLLDVLELHGMPVSVGPWNLVFDVLRTTICEYNATPSFALLHEDQVVDGQADIEFSDEFDAVFTYGYDPETGYRLAKLYRQWIDYTGDWWVLGGRWAGMLIPKTAEAVEQVIPDSGRPAGLALEESIGALLGALKRSRATRDQPMQRNSLKMEDVDWGSTTAQCACSVPVELILEVSQKYNLKCPELLFEEIYGNDLRALPEAMRANIRINKRHELWQLFWNQFERDPEIPKDDRAVMARYMSFLGYTQDQLERYNQIAVYLQAGVVFEGKYYDNEADPVSTDPLGIEDLIVLGGKLRDLPPETVVTVVDLHY